MIASSDTIAYLTQTEPFSIVKGLLTTKCDISISRRGSLSHTVYIIWNLQATALADVCHFPLKP